jgi:hypothetical protein
MISWYESSVSVLGMLNESSFAKSLLSGVELAFFVIDDTIRSPFVAVWVLWCRAGARFGRLNRQRRKNVKRL